MKQLLTSLLLALALGSTVALAQNENEGKYILQNGNTTMTIDAQKGAKILSYKYGDQEMLSQLRWPESFGSTFWTSPQKEWYWPPVPEYDKKPYQVERDGKVLRMTSEVSERLKYRIRKEFAVDEKDQAMVVTYTIINESDETRKVAPWEITRVVNDGGLIFFEAPADSIWPAGLMNFKDGFGAAWYQADEAGENRKVNADGKGWLAYCSNGLLLVKRFEDLNARQPAPDEAEIQVYVNRGKSYIELESQGAYTTLKPKEQLSWTVRWYLMPYTGEQTPSAELFQQAKKENAQKSIVILYENDVHCGIDGYTKIAGLRDAINKTDTAYAAAVCVGDFLQGNTTGAISKGQYIADILRYMDYHALTLGNHEFDYGVPRLKELLAQVGTPVVCANFYEAGEPQPVYAPYVIHQYGNKKIAFIGACTPETMILEGYSFYDTNGILLYDLKPKTFYQLIQQAVDDARAEGADYVILLSHVGETPQSMGFSSHRLVNNTRGIDIVLDGHSHEIIEGVQVKNLDGKEITVTQTGTQFANVGKLLITPDGRFITNLIKGKDVPYENAKITATTDSIHKMVEAVTSAKVAHSDYRLVVSDENAQWVVRGEETNAGDLVADAYRYALKADIGFENGGGIRNDILAGDITYGDIIGMLPYDNTLRRISVTGEQLLQMLTRCTALVPVLDGNFPQCSGLRFTIHSKSHKVSDIEVLQEDGSYAPLNLKRTYSVALTNYNHDAGGFFDSFKKCPVLFESSIRYYEALADYLSKALKGTTGPTYAQPQGRIKIIED